MGTAVLGTAAVVTAFGVTGWAFGTPSAVMALAGAMAVLYARGEPYVHRLVAVVGIGLLILGLSEAASISAPSRWALLAVLTAGAAAAGLATETLRTAVPGPTMILVPATMVAAIPTGPGLGVGLRAEMIGLGSGLALLLTLSPWLISRHGPETRALGSAYQVIARALRSAATPTFHRERAQAWSALAAAGRALRLADKVPGRDGERVSALHALGGHAEALLLQAQRMHTSLNPASGGAAAAAQEVAEHLRAAHLRPDASGRLPLLAGPDTEAAETWARTALAMAGRPEVMTPSHHGAGLRSRLGLRATLSRHSLTYPARLALASMAGGAIAIGIGLDHWYWAPVCAVAAIWGSDTWVTWHRAVQRAVATAAGCVAAAGFMEANIDLAVGVTLVGLLFFSAELLFPRNYGLAMAPITAMILLIIHLASPVSIDGWTLAAQRIAAASLGSAIGLLAVLVAWPSSATAQTARLITGADRLQNQIRAQMGTGLMPRDDLVSLRGQLLGSLLRLDRTASLATGEARVRSLARDRYMEAALVGACGHHLLAQIDDYLADGELP